MANKTKQLAEDLISSRCRLTALLLGIIPLFGLLGFHNFYLGQKQKGKIKILMLFLYFCGFILRWIIPPIETGSWYVDRLIMRIYDDIILSICIAELLWVFAEVILIAFGLAKDGDGLPVKRWFEKKM